MGFQDRDYLRETRYNDGGYYRRGEMKMVTKIIILNFALFVINAVLTNNDLLFKYMSVTGETLLQPLYYWQFLTYGFAHSPNDLWHIAGNMLTLFFLGYAVEERLGAWEFLRFYLLTIIAGGIVYAAANFGAAIPCLGASGGVTGVVMLFILWYPRQMLYVWGILPVPAWILGAFIVGSEFLGLLGSGRQNVAYVVHLVGVASAFLYVAWRTRFGDLSLRNLGNNLSNLARGCWRFSPKKAQTKKPSLRVYDPLAEDEEAHFAREVDQVLQKYSEHGEAALTKVERELLKKASERYRKKYGDLD